MFKEARYIVCFAKNIDKLMPRDAYNKQFLPELDIYEETKKDGFEKSFKKMQDKFRPQLGPGWFESDPEEEKKIKNEVIEPPSKAELEAAKQEALEIWYK